MQQSILAIFPHPDDESFVSAGTLIHHVKNGDMVTLVCATLGQMGRRMGKPFFATRETLPHVREKELRQACHIIGIHDLRLWKMQDKMLQFRDKMYLAGSVLQVILETEPAIIYTFYPKHGVHPDHDALSAATISAVEQLPLTKRPIVFGAAITKNRYEILGKPTIEMDVSDVFREKVSALKAHKSQTSHIVDQLNAVTANQLNGIKQIPEAYIKEKYWVYDFGTDSVS
ncbi:bacillithiol biosynthesis deacetylase BshB2 [Virgibacillus halophilus]|uniref:Bacillithiol biosynthesis deacetylase BshB2 n=1 Tax=Tigheibacillus halophilus TaxID=361280 RepID=A0ABU5C223_9BACI|nr:bacillithiol biosynthesis deacetylase BshB2 [Virgibacillus halophilus]